MNLTQEQKVVSGEREGYVPLPGHDLVIYSVSNSRRKLEQHIKDGEEFKPTLMSRLGTAYVSHTVNMNPQLRHQFSERKSHMMPGHSFDLTFVLHYCVEDPTIIVQRLHDDPLNAVRQEILRVVASKVACIPWVQIEAAKRTDNFAERSAAIYHECSPKLENFAANYGIKLLQPEIGLGLVEDAVPLETEADLARKDLIARSQRRFETGEYERLKAQEEDAHELNTVKQHNANELSALQAQARIRDAAATALGKAFDNVATHTETAEDIERNVRVITGALSSAQTANKADYRARLGTSSPAPALLEGHRRSEVAKLIDQVIQDFDSYADQPGKKRQFFAAALHWVAEMSLGNKADEALLTKWRMILEDKPDDITNPQFRSLQELLNRNELTGRLS